MGRSDQPANITSALEALSPWLNNPRWTVIQIEVFMAVAVVLLFFQLIFGSLRRRTNSSIIHGGLWLAYTLLTPLITYTLGLMQSSPIKTGLYPVWALSLFLIAGSANSITAYDIDDNKQWKRQIFVLFQCQIYMSLLILLYTPTTGWFSQYVHFSSSTFRQPFYIPLVLLVSIVVLANMTGIIASWMVNYSDPSKVVADYMKDQGNSRGDSQAFDPVSMKGCKYLVHWPDLIAAWRDGRPSYRNELPDTDVVTVEMVWDKFNEDTFITPGISSRVKGACLSFALAHLLRRRFFGMDCSEASLPETRRFVLEGLLSENTEEYTEAFRVIEVELGFLYDFFYTKYASIFRMENVFLFMVTLKIVCTFILGVVLLFKSPTILTHNPIIEVNTRTFDTVITVVLLGTFLAVETLQSILYMATDWAMVSLACYHVTGSGYLGKIPSVFHKAIGILIKRPLFSYWQNNIGQYSVIEGSQFLKPETDRNPSRETQMLLIFVHFRLFEYIVQSLRNIFSSNGLHFVRLPDIVKSEIISSLKSNFEGRMTNGRTSLERNGVFRQFKWTLQNETQTESMLIWHIATDYCKIAVCEEEEVFVGSSQEGHKQLSSYQYREVSTKLSCYCAYLMSNIPELLPGNFVDTRFAFDQAMYDAKESLGTKTRNRDGLLNAIDRPRVEGTIFTKGLKLGKELESMQDSFRRWKLIAEFWAETILYIAPSDNAKTHMERLAQGGEFLTHIWALLTHAGILTRNEEPIAADEIA